MWYRILSQEPPIHDDSMRIQAVVVKRSDTWNAVKRELINQSRDLRDYTVGMIKLYASYEQYLDDEEILDLSEPVGSETGGERKDPIIVAASAVYSKKFRLSPDVAGEFSQWLHRTKGIPFADRGFELGKLKPFIQGLINKYKVEVEKVKDAIAQGNHDLAAAQQGLNPKTGSIMLECIKDTFVQNQQRFVELENEIDYLRAILNERLRWTDPPRLPFQLVDGMKFVNRSNTMGDLLRIHRSNFHLAVQDGEGPSIVVPFIDNSEGMGKTAFARNYIAHLSTDLDGNYSEEFRHSISTARTIVLKLEEGALLQAMEQGQRECEQQLVAEFMNHIKGKLETGEMRGSERYLEALLSPRPGLFRDVVRRFIMETGEPLFLAFDDIGAAFSRQTDAPENVSRGQLVHEKLCFFNFCRNILIPAMQVLHFHVLLLGGGEFMKLVGDRNDLDSVGVGGSAVLRRIGLNMIRREYIPSILAGTFRVKCGRDVSLEEFYGLHVSHHPRYQKLLDALVAASNGHPRTMWNILLQSKTYRTLLKTATRLSNSSVQKSCIMGWFTSLIPHQACVRLFLRIASDSDVHASVGQCANLRELSSSHVDGNFTRLQVATLACFRWEGTLENAKLFVTKGVRRHLSMFFMTFREFISEILPESPDNIEYFINFQKCCGKRFQELFPEQMEGRDYNFITRWFGQSRHKSHFETLRIGDYVGVFPKISDQGDDVFGGLHQATAKPCLWQRIRRAILTSSPRGAFYSSLIPSTSGVILLASAKASDGTDRKVTIGLAVTCLQGSLGEAFIETEKRIFNRMFESTSLAGMETSAYSPPKTRQPSARTADQMELRSDDEEDPSTNTENGDVNIVIFCNTGSDSSPKFEAGGFSIVEGPSPLYPHIHETIYLNLSNSKMRSDFFGVSGDNDTRLRTNLEFLVTKECENSVSHPNPKHNS